MPYINVVFDVTVIISVAGCLAACLVHIVLYWYSSWAKMSRPRPTTKQIKTSEWQCSEARATNTCFSIYFLLFLFSEIRTRYTGNVNVNFRNSLIVIARRIMNNLYLIHLHDSVVDSANAREKNGKRLGKQSIHIDEWMRWVRDR